MTDCIKRKDALVAIRNLYSGIPFTKAMRQRWHDENRAYMQCERAVESIPAADVVEMRKAKWVATDKYMVDKCSNCQFEMDWDDVPLWLVDMPHFKDSCPSCGAKMDGGEDDGKRAL